MTAGQRGGGSGAAVRVGLGLASVALALLILVGFRAPQDGVVMGAARSGGGAAGGTGTSGTTGSGSATTGTGRSTASGTYDGSVVDTRYGSVQVEITVQGGKVVSVTGLQLPGGGRSGMISSYVAPILSSEALTAQSARIDVVSGATYTSDGYAQSLQAALDQAGI